MLAELFEANAEAARLSGETRAAAAQISLQEKALDELQKEKRHIDMFAFATHLDFGPNNMFYSFAGRSVCEAK